MTLTVEEQNEREYLLEIRKSRTRVMMPLEQDRLSYITKKEFHNCCSNIHCSGYEGSEIETNCPKCNYPLHKLIS